MVDRHVVMQVSVDGIGSKYKGQSDCGEEDKVKG